jgi:S-adenosylmethionine decarboxylase
LHDLGVHVLLDLGGCPRELLADREGLRLSLHRAAREAGATIVGEAFHAFTPTGVSGVLLIAESHLSIHTWPERGEAALDVYTCGEGFDAESAADRLVVALGATEVRRRSVRRGASATATRHGPAGTPR